jgi:hypothetical protein
LDEFTLIYRTRLEAKKNGNKAVAETLKVAINSVFGKTASKWSPLYSPDLALAITLTGQLTLLSMIEQFTERGADVLSANTDGIAIGASPEVMLKIRNFVSAYSDYSGFDFEYTAYRALAMKDVNNYIAIKMDRSVKGKGLYADPDLKKNVAANICTVAVKEWLAHGTPFEDTIWKGEFVDFLSARNVTGGAVQGDQYLGRVARWYNSTDKTLPPLTYSKNGNKVPKTEGAKAAMIIDPRIKPIDLDYNWYYKEAITIAKNVGASDYLSSEELAAIAPPPKVRKSAKK